MFHYVSYHVPGNMDFDWQSNSFYHCILWVNSRNMLCSTSTIPPGSCDKEEQTAPLLLVLDAIRQELQGMRCDGLDMRTPGNCLSEVRWSAR